MNRAAVSIPEKLFFKIGEVCDITGVQAHVLRYWESEFPTLAPQKNRAGQRTYRKRDVEMVLRIKELLYEDQFTIAGAKKKLTSEIRGASKLKMVTPEMNASTVATQTVAPSTPSFSTPSILPQPAAEPVIPTSQQIASGSLAAQIRTGFEAVASADISNLSLTEEQRSAMRRLKVQLHELLGILESGDGQTKKLHRS